MKTEITQPRSLSVAAGSARCAWCHEPAGHTMADCPAAQNNSETRQHLLICRAVLRTAAEAIESNKRHLESMGRHCTTGTHEALDEIANALSWPNK